MSEDHAPLTNNTGDELVLDWWEAYDNGWSVGLIADRWLVPVRLVHVALNTLGVLDRDRTGQGGHANERNGVADLVDGEYVQQVVERPDRGELAIMAALAKLRPDCEGDNGSRRHLPWAASLPHVKPHRARVPMSARQRGQDALAGGWAKTIRRDLRHAGLIP